MVMTHDIVPCSWYGRLYARNVHLCAIATKVQHYKKLWNHLQFTADTSNLSSSAWNGFNLIIIIIQAHLLTAIFLATLFSPTQFLSINGVMIRCIAIKQFLTINYSKYSVDATSCRMLRQSLCDAHFPWKLSTFLPKFYTMPELLITNWNMEEAK